MGLRKLYPDYEIKQTNIVFNFLGDFNNNLRKELSDLAHKKDFTKALTNSQKWIISQDCDITKKFYSLKHWMKHTFFLVQELLPRHCPQRASLRINCKLKRAEVYRDIHLLRYLDQWTVKVSMMLGT